MSVAKAAKGSGTNRVDATHEALRDLIVSGQLAPGSRLIETDLANRLDVSRRTLQGALERLQREGLIHRLEGKRAPWEVSPLTNRDCREISDVMSALLGWAARRAAELEAGARERLVREMVAINDDLREVHGVLPADSSRAAELDVRFHDLVLEAVAGARLRAIYEGQKPTVERYARNYATYLSATSPTSSDEHQAIIEAIRRGDPDEADRASRRNWSNAADRYCEVMQAVGEQGIW